MPVGDPPVSFRAAPTYVLEQPLDNFIAGRELIAEAIAGTLGPHRGEPPRQRDQRGRADVERAPLAAGGGSAPRRRKRPRRGGDRHRAGARLLGTAHRAGAGRAVAGPRTDGPDACLHVPGWGWMLIDARFGGGTDTLADAAATEAWLEQYSASAPGLFDDDALRRVRVKDLPHRTLETIAFAHQLKADGRAGGRRRPRARERVGRSRAAGSAAASPTPPTSASAASPGSRSTRPSTRTTTPWRRSATTSRTRATASAPRSPSTTRPTAEAG